MAKRICCECGCEYNPGPTKRAVNKFFKDPFIYQNCIDEDLCYDCAVNYIRQNLDAGLDLDFELSTGRDRSERPDDWDFSF